MMRDTTCYDVFRSSWRRIMRVTGFIGSRPLRNCSELITTKAELDTIAPVTMI